MLFHQIFTQSVSRRSAQMQCILVHVKAGEWRSAFWGKSGEYENSSHLLMNPEYDTPDRAQQVSSNKLTINKNTPVTVKQ